MIRLGSASVKSPILERESSPRVILLILAGSWRAQARNLSVFTRRSDSAISDASLLDMTRANDFERVSLHFIGNDFIINEFTFYTRNDGCVITENLFVIVW